MPATTLETDMRSVNMIASEEAAAIEAGDFKRYLALLAEDALFMPPNLPSKIGRELRGWLRDFVDHHTVEYLKLADDETAVEGNLAYHRFTYAWKVTPHSGGETKVGQGKGMHIFRRQPDGAWKIAREIWNSNPAP